MVYRADLLIPVLDLRAGDVGYLMQIYYSTKPFTDLPLGLHGFVNCMDNCSC